MKRGLPLVFVAAVFLSGCLVDKGELVEPPVCETFQPNYVDTAKTIIDTHCAVLGCHGQGSVIGDFTTYESMEARGGVLEASGILNRINSNDPSVVMPPGNTLPQEQKDVLTCWAENSYQKQ
ncbi:hypothetical protein N9J52_03460 [Flavobacteriales bacterium]|nr:hypothetical protein [Flavobacteriales bacterium]